MKAVLFFYLNLLGPVLVQTQTRRPYFDPLTTVGVDCKLTKAGREYAGSLNVTKSGRTCQRWDSDQPHINKYKDEKLYPEGSPSAAGNKCRNPDGNYNDGVWCYTTDPITKWEHCDVPYCDLGCKLTKAGYEYAGPLSVSKSGRTCQRWDSDKPHINKYKDSKLYPDGSASAAGNKCRNPSNGYNEGPWCYTTDPSIEWEQCDVELCGFTSPIFPMMPHKSTTSSQISSTQTRTSTRITTPSSTTNTRSMPPFPTNPKTSPTSTTNLMTILTATEPFKTLRSPSTKEATTTIRLSSQPLQETISSHENSSTSIVKIENSSTNIVKIVIPIVGVIVVICVIVVIIIWRRTGLFQSSWRSPSSAERNQQATVALNAKPMQNDISLFDNPDYDNCQHLVAVYDTIKDHSSTDYITIADSAVDYATVDQFRLS